MAKAVWRGAVIADSDETVVVEGNHYFPPDSVDDARLKESSHRSWCPWKGTAGYYSVEVDGELNKNAAWYYPDPRRAAKKIKDRIAFWHGVEVVG